ncbi:MAG: GNAT family N-acetyltransferase [Jaaginema sp. PMC 1079.18]|nr:GNAT family N-acetyltransferase [Jaaginema sp. PMC 1080.18]MEC4851602.1 GNAT family N-acetyltransferase [Jaaginema sp. PMC 1079.18]MEC4865067.1 GNAT family N-acetyltransferase [Jaaginema sp. PMC 1078.18]
MTISGYDIQPGSIVDRALLLRFMTLTYQELFPEVGDFSHLVQTVEQYFSPQTPLWWAFPAENSTTKVGCIWVGNGIDQIQGDRYAHIFLLYVKPEHRRQGLGKSLMQQAQTWATQRGDRQIGLHVFCQNQGAIALYQQLGFSPQSWLMLKPLTQED